MVGAGAAVGTTLHVVTAVAGALPRDAAAAVALVCVAFAPNRVASAIPQSRWRVPEAWLVYGRVRFGAMFGGMLGLGVATALPAAGFVALVAVTLAVPALWTAVLVFGVFGAARAAPFLFAALAAWRNRSASATVDGLTRFARRLVPVEIALLLVGALLLATSSSAGRSANPRAAFYMLDRSVRLVALSARGSRIRTLRIGRPAGPSGYGRYLVLGRDGALVWALHQEPHGPDKVVGVRTRDFAIVARYRLPRGVEFRSLARGDRTGRLYVFGNRPGAWVDALERREQSVVLAVIDPATGSRRGPIVVRNAERHDWRVYRGLVVPGERRLLVSYHGRDTTGIDWLEVSRRGELSRCGARDSGTSCIRTAHGNVEIFGRGLIAALGTPPTVAEVDWDDRLVRQWPTLLDGNHLMEFVVVPGGRTAYAFGSCEYTGGVARLDLVGMAVRRLIPPSTRRPVPDPAVCADRGLVAGNRLVLARRIGGNQFTRRRPAVLFVDLASARLVRTAPLTFDPVDLIAATP